jgi:Tol biopolymer transport system component
MGVATDTSGARPLCSLLLAFGLFGNDLGQRVNQDLAAGEDVSRWLLAPDGTRVYYEVTQPGFEAAQLFSVSVDGTQNAFELTDPLGLGRRFYTLQLSADGGRIAYTADQDTDEQWELYTVSTDGSKDVVKLNPPLAPTVDVYPGYFRFTPDGTRVVFRLSNSVVYSAPADGSAPAVQLSGNTNGLFQVTADSQRVVYPNGDVFGVPVDGSAPPVQLSGTIIDEQVWDFFVSPDGQRVVYMGVTYPPEPDPEFSNPRYWIFSVPADGSLEPALLFDPIRPIHWIGSPALRIQISPDSHWVVHRTDSYPSPNELLAAPIDGSAPAVRLSDPPDGGGVGSDFRFTPDGRVVYGYSANGVPTGLYVVRADGSTSPQHITELTQSPLPLKWEVSGSRAVFVGYALDPITSEARYEPYSAPLSGSAPPVKLNPPMVPGGDIVNGNSGNIPSLSISPDGEWVAYMADQETDGVDELYVAPIDGRMRARKLNRPLPAGADVNQFSFQFTPDSRRGIYSADQDELDRHELFESQLGSRLPSLGAPLPLIPGRPIH